MTLHIEVIDERGDSAVDIVEFPDRTIGWPLMERCARLSEKYPRFVASFTESNAPAANGRTITTIINRLRNK